VLYSIKTESLQADLFRDPSAPVLDIFLDLGVAVVYVGEHHIVCVSLLIVDTLAPAFALSAKLVNRLLLVGSIVVGAAEVIPVVLLLAVFVASARELKP